jgi:hypothetical protein
MAIEGNEQFTAAARALNEAADKALRKEVYAAFRTAAKPLGQQMVEEGSKHLPQRGGLGARVAAAKVSQSNATTGRNPSVALKIKVREGYDLKRMDQGEIRHRVFGTDTWVRQKIAPGAFTKPFQAGADAVRREVLRALERVAEQIRSGSAGGKFGGHL